MKKLWLTALVAIVLSAFSSAATQYSPAVYKDYLAKCMRVLDYNCAEHNLRSYIILQPLDSNAVAQLAIILAMDGKPKEAVPQFEKAINMGEGTYNLFGYYADSLFKVGRVDDAIDWSYKTLAVLPKAVDIRGNLAKMLVLRKRHYEALALLAGYDAQQEMHGLPEYFPAQRIAIESSLEHQGGAVPVEQAGLRLAKNGDHFYAPVSAGQSRTTAFVVDTGASITTMSESFLRESKAEYKVVKPTAAFRLADGRVLHARIVSVAALKIGAFELKETPVVVCETCEPLLGQKALSHFDLKSNKVQGVEFLTLTPRAKV